MPEPEIKIEVEAEPTPVDIKIVEEEKKVDLKGAVENAEEDHEPPQDHPRFKKIYGKMKEGERQIEKLLDDSKSKDDLMQAMKDHNTALQDAFDKLADNKDETVKRDLKTIHDGLLKEKKQAFEEGNYDKLVDVDERLFELKVAMNKKPEKVIKDKPATVAPRVKSDKQNDIDDFKKSAEWFDKDDMMTGAAMELEKVLIKKHGNSKAYSDILGEVKSEVEKRFKYESPKDDEEETGMQQTVEGGSNISGKAKPNSVKMSREEMDVAAKLGVTPENFAKQKILMERTKK